MKNDPEFKLFISTNVNSFVITTKKSTYSTKIEHMKNYLPFIFIAILLYSFPSISSGQKRSARFEAEFQKTFQIVNSDRFMIRFFIATPTGQTFVATPSEGPNVTIDPEQCYLEIQDSLVSGACPISVTAVIGFRDRDKILFDLTIFFFLEQ